MLFSSTHSLPFLSSPPASHRILPLSSSSTSLSTSYSFSTTSSFTSSISTLFCSFIFLSNSFDAASIAIRRRPRILCMGMCHAISMCACVCLFTTLPLIFSNPRNIHFSPPYLSSFFPSSLSLPFFSNPNLIPHFRRSPKPVHYPVNPLFHLSPSHPYLLHPYTSWPRFPSYPTPSSNSLLPILLSRLAN